MPIGHANSAVVALAMALYRDSGMPSAKARPWQALSQYSRERWLRQASRLLDTLQALSWDVTVRRHVPLPPADAIPRNQSAQLMRDNPPPSPSAAMKAAAQLLEQLIASGREATPAELEQIKGAVVIGVTSGAAALAKGVH